MIFRGFIVQILRVNYQKVSDISRYKYIEMYAMQTELQNIFNGMEVLGYAGQRNHSKCR